MLHSSEQRASLSTSILFPPPLSAFAFTLPPSPPLCPDHCPVHPSAQEQWSTLKEKQEERGARCHGVACLLTKPLKAAPHKSKRNIMVIVSPRATEIPLLFCPPLFLGFFGSKRGQSQGWRFFYSRGPFLVDLAPFKSFLTAFLFPSPPLLSDHPLVLCSCNPQH